MSREFERKSGSLNRVFLMTSYFILLFQFLSLSFWIGGSVVLLMIVAPTAFHVLPPSLDASEIVGSFFKKFSSLFVLNAIFLGATLYVQTAFLSHGIALKLRLAITLVSVATLIAAYHRFALLPSIERVRASMVNRAEVGEINGATRVKSLQRRSLTLFSVNLFLGVAVVITLLLPFR